MNTVNKDLRKKGSDYPRFEVRVRTTEEKIWLEEAVSAAKKMLDKTKLDSKRSTTKKEAVIALFKEGLKGLRKSSN